MAMIPSSRGGTRIAQALCACAVLLAVALTDACSKSKGVESRPPEADDVVTVATARTTTQNLSRDLELTAEFRPFQEVDVMAKVAGYVKVIHVDVGDRVKEGQVLAVLEIPEMADDQARAQAAIDRSKSEVKRAQDQLNQAK